MKRKRKKRIIDTIRKPMAPPVRIGKDVKKYNRTKNLREMLKHLVKETEE